MQYIYNASNYICYGRQKLLSSRSGQCAKPLGRPPKLIMQHCKRVNNTVNLTKVTIYLLTSCNTEERIAQNIYIHNSNKNNYIE